MRFRAVFWAQDDIDYLRLGNTLSVCLLQIPVSDWNVEWMRRESMPAAYVEVALLVGAVGACTVGAYACCLWRKKLELERNRLYVESVVRLAEAFIGRT